MSYADIYEQEEKNRSLIDYVKDPSELTTDKGTFTNFMEIAKLNAEETFKTNSIIAEQFNEREYNIENDKKIKNIISNEEYYGIYSRYKKVDYERYSQIKSDLETGTYQKNKNKDYIEDLKAVKYIEGIMNDNPELKFMTKDDRRKNVTKEIERLRNNKAIRTSQQDSVVGEFAGSVAGMLADPVNLATLFIPVAGQAKNASLLIRSLETGAKTALFEGGVESFNQIMAVVPYRRDYLGDNYTTMDAVGAVTTTAFGSFVLGGGLQAVGDLGSAFLRRNKDKTPAQKVYEAHEKQREKNPENVTASEIEASNNLQVINNQVAKAEDEFQDTNIQAFQKAISELSAGKKVEVEEITDPMRKKQFEKVIDNILEAKDLTAIKRKFGKELTDYIKDNNIKIKEDLKNRTLREVFNEIQEEFDNKLFFDKEVIKVVGKNKEVEGKDKKLNSVLKREFKFNDEAINEIDLTLNDLDNIMSITGKEKEVAAFREQLEITKAELQKAKIEQDNLLDFQACLLN